MAYKDKLIIASHIGDLHIGVSCIEPYEMKYQLNEMYIKPLEELAMLDIISVNGDLSHDILSLNSKDSEVYLWFVNRITEIAKKKNAIVIFIVGTLSHEFDQMNNLKVFQNDFVYFASKPTVIETKGLKIYCLPDIYIKDSKEEAELYQYKDKYFDYILGHGSVTETQFIKQEGENTISKNVVYDTKELIRMCKGPIIFGHIHTYMKIKNQLYYTSSFTRFIHGEEADKGTLISAYIPEDSKFLVERVINTLAFNFNEYNIGHQTLDDTEAEDIILKIEKFITEYKVDKLALVVDYINSDINIAKINILRNYFNRNKIVNKMKFKSLSPKEAEFIKTETVIDDSKKYLIDKSIPYSTKLQTFMKEEYGVTVPIENIETVLYSDKFITRN